MSELPAWFIVPFAIAAVVYAAAFIVVGRRRQARPDMPWEEQRTLFWVAFGASCVLLGGVVVAVVWSAIDAGDGDLPPFSSILIGLVLIAVIYWLTTRPLVMALKAHRASPGGSQGGDPGP